MLRILEQKNLADYQEILQKLPDGIQFHLTEALADDDSVQGYILYAYEPEQVNIYAVDDGNDWNYCDGLVRSVLFKAQLRGLDKARFLVEDSAMIARFSKLGFVKNDEKTMNHIADFMENCKKCKENPTNT